MAMTEAQYLELEGNVNAIWDAYLKQANDYITEYYNVIKKTASQFTDMTMGAPGRMHDWTGSVQYDNLEKGYTKQYKATKKDTGIQIDRDMWEDKEYERIKSYVNSIAYGVKKTLNYESAATFNDAFTTTITGPDGVCLCSASHHLIPGDTHQSNTTTLALSYDNFETILRAMEDWEDDRGDKMLIEGNLLVASPYWRRTCKQLFGSDKEAYVADNQDNAYKDFNYIIHPLLTGRKYFVCNRETMKGGSGLNWFMRRDPRTLERDGDAAKGDFNTEKLSWKAIGRWVRGWTNWYWCYGSTGTV